MILLKQLRKLLEKSDIKYVYRKNLEGLALKISVNPEIPEDLKSFAESEYAWDKEKGKFFITVYLLVEEEMKYLSLWVPQLCQIDTKLKLRDRIKTLILTENPQLYYGGFGFGNNKFIYYNHGVSLERGGDFITINELNDYLQYTEYICGDFLKEFISLRSEKSHG